MQELLLLVSGVPDPHPVSLLVSMAVSSKVLQHLATLRHHLWVELLVPGRQQAVGHIEALAIKAAAAAKGRRGAGQQRPTSSTGGSEGRQTHTTATPGLSALHSKGVRPDRNRKLLK